MKTLFYPFPPLITGFILGILVALGGVTMFGVYVFNNIASGAWAEQTGIVRSIGDQVRHGVLEENATSIYGNIQAIENGTISLEVRRATGQHMYTFSYDASTVFVRLNNDDASTEIPISPTELVVGEGVTVFTNEPVGGTATKHLVKAVKI